MPIYTYRCDICGKTDSAFRKIAERDRYPQIDCECRTGDGRQPRAVSRIVEAPYVAPDIGPYQAVAVDVATGRPPVINSRSAHREFLKRNGYVEVGNESVGRKAGEVRGDFNLRSELTSATREVLGKTR
ncbi:FmdB family zinc ribbon protein [Burkholderia cenocepacia]|uniref:zinc ribbon domain-containing protein n=1 Tax=Burkholderia cenocepacia TaxID=95486 RepID=UPI002AB21A46|nr:zinc ribbon domain-containing protein [Burkholderia cenocepacia]